jgi:hypothetical protein
VLIIFSAPNCVRFGLCTTGENHGLLAFELQPQDEAILFVFVDRVASVAAGDRARIQR